MPKASKIFMPADISGIFEIHDEAPNPLFRGSRGAGLCISCGVAASASKMEGGSRAVINGKISNSLITSSLLKKLGVDGVEVRYEHKLPLSCGFGLSGASALAGAKALSELFDLPLRMEEIGRIAHLVEIELGTGLGDVIGQLAGGFAIVESPGAPGIGRLKRIEERSDLEILVKVFGPIPTSSIIRSGLKERINEIAPPLIDDLIYDPTLDEFMRVSLDFTLRSGLATDRVKKSMDKLRSMGIDSSMMMVGDGVFSILRKDESDRLEKAKKEYEGLGGWRFSLFRW
jgi:pantoate kinase